MSDISKDFHALLHRIDDVAADDYTETTPYASQYRVLEILQKIRVATPSPAQKAVVAAKLGGVYLAVGEPHNAEPMLYEAGQFFVQELVTFTQKIPLDDSSKGEVKIKEVVTKLLADMPQVEIKNEHEEFEGYVVELLTQMGLLWSKRSRLLRAVCYLTAALNVLDKCGHKKADGMVSAQTMTRLYLAQSYEKLGMADNSAEFCLSTLELQLLQCFDDTETGDMSKPTGAPDWVRNALKLAEYYLDANNLKDAAICLQGCEYMLLYRGIDEGDEEEEEEAQMLLVADIYSMWGRLHMTTLRFAGMRKEGSYARNAGPALHHLSSMEAIFAKLSLARQWGKGQLKPGLGMMFVSPHCVETYEQARDVFKMGIRACTRARKAFDLDGFVTEHVRLLQQESALYRQLLPFEDSRGRRVAMQRRRLALLTSVLGDTLNERSIPVDILQEIYFECAEINTDVFEIKQSKEAGEKPMTYAIGAIQCYQQFLLLYYPPSEVGGATNNDQVRARVLRGGKDAQLPHGKALCPREFRAMLMGYYGLAHVCGKVLCLSDTAKIVGFWRQSLAYYEVVPALVREYENLYHASYGHELSRSLKSEVTICGEMARLLPEKIDQLVYNGKALKA
ncbi:unnamed protein product [Hyaloperonospora brassicae]|uniref:KIF-binding protein n=1 Tax=Hyaloperonospora brassicae TaxID=162125 RepID=A0AAV0TAH8_HYABA|nr:unnamed protein product [Hyaloperonospora brassicae]